MRSRLRILQLHSFNLEPLLTTSPSNCGTLTFASRLTSGGYEDKSWAYYPKQQIVHRGWQIFDPSWRYSWCYYPKQQIVQRGWRLLTPREDKVDVITQVNILFRGGGNFLGDDDDNDVDDDHDDCKCGATSGLGRTILKEWHVDHQSEWGMVSYKLHQITTIFFSWVIVAKPPMSSANLYGLVQQERIWLRYPTKELVKGCKMM